MDVLTSLHWVFRLWCPPKNWVSSPGMLLLGRTLYGLQTPHSFILLDSAGQCKN